MQIKKEEEVKKEIRIRKEEVESRGIRRWKIVNCVLSSICVMRALK